jgi:hypothetical protein
MFGIITPDDDQLALTIEIEGIDNPEPRLPRPAARQAKPPAKQHLDNC